ncbi:MAG TPA: hypothetical protein ENH63_09805 [Sulfitobacter litoralis]|uniref:Uncharacterized protein n=1 Tax=Sulfitobacter litoralis TaxID=335975 RepID=A0A7V1A699_9RHOB|nr:hypothetical protein [Sulfitobacter litoralis]HDY95272.1 hypothetical protein [Sulfitobacter litoralis]HDZ52045.1 hypothetical protein [Sulfitobacter litoralis]
MGQKTLPRFSGSALGDAGGGVLVVSAGFTVAALEGAALEGVVGFALSGFDAGVAGLVAAVSGFTSFRSGFVSLGVVSDLVELVALDAAAVAEDALAGVSLAFVVAGGGVVISLVDVVFAEFDGLSSGIAVTPAALPVDVSLAVLSGVVLSGVAALAGDGLTAGLGLAVEDVDVDAVVFDTAGDPVFLAVVFGLAAAADARDVEDVFGVSSPEFGVFAFATLKNLSDSDLISDVFLNLRRHIGRPSS